MSFDPKLFEAIKRGDAPTLGQPQPLAPMLLNNPNTGEKFLVPNVAVVAFQDDAINQFMRVLSMRDDLTRCFVAATVVQQRNMRHKKRGGRAGEWTLAEIVQHLKNEVEELHDAITYEETAPPAGKSSMRAKVLSETADVLCVVYAIMIRYGFTLQEVNIQGVQKLEERFTDEASEEEMLVKGGEAKP